MNDGNERVALFGGSFDPPHCGHLGIAAAAVEQTRLSRVIFIPCQESPLKGRQPGAPGAERLEMLRLAVDGLRWAEVSDCELRRPGPSYSWQTVEQFAANNPNTSLHWIMGADQWEILERWARAEFLRNSLTFIVFARGGMTPVSRDGWRAVFLPGEFAESSTEARRALSNGDSAAGLVPPAVAEYGARHGLYRPADRR